MAHYCFICRHRSDSIPDDLIEVPFHSVLHNVLQMPWLKSIPDFSFQSVKTCGICNGKALEIIELSQKIKFLQFDLERSRQEINRTLLSKYGPPGEYLDPMERLGRMIVQIQSECSVQIHQMDPVYPVVSLKEFDADIQVNFDIKSEADSLPGSPWLPEVNEGSNQDLNEEGRDPDPQTITSAKPKKRKPVYRADTNEKKDLSVNCPHCGLTFQKPTALIIHIRFKHYDPSKPRPRRNKVNRELIQNEKKDQSVNCPHCDLTFQKPTALIIHMRFKHQDPEKIRLDLTCPHCSKKFASKRCRDNHVAAIHDQTTSKPRPKRNKVRRELIQKQNFDTRSEADSPPGSPWLPEVNEVSNLDLNEEERDPDPQSIPSAKPKKRKRVYRADTNEKKDLSVNCPHCGITFQKPTALVMHIRFKHYDPSKPRPRRNKVNRELIQNEKKNQSVKCPHCDLTFQKPTALIIHMRFKHQDPEKIRLDLTCPHCSKTFASKRCRDNHVAAIHDQTTKFVCHMCGQSFTSRSRLGNHMIYTHGEKTLKCSFCDHKFKTKTQLKHHEDRHSGCPTIVCEICGKAFYHIEALNRHKDSTHSTKSASCPQCGKVFQSIKHVRGHITRTHKQMWRKWVATAKEKARKNAEGSSKNNEDEIGNKVNEEENSQKINEEENSRRTNENVGHQANIFHNWQQWQSTH